MREIKFRAYDGAEWVYGTTINYNEHDKQWSIYNDSTESWSYCGKPYQYTGLKDANGIEIYERDIIKCTNGIDEVYEEIGTVVFDLDECGYKVQYSKDSATHCIYLINAEKFSDRFYEISYEVIGNAYENKELLEGERK